MKNLKYCLLITTLFFAKVNAQQSKCNYIEDYYPVVYKAQIEYLKGNFEKSYHLFDSVRSKCELLNNQDIIERIVFAELSGRKGLYDQAFHYLQLAIKDGFNFVYIEGNENLDFLKSHPKWNELKKEADSLTTIFEKTTEYKLRDEIIAMIKEDQEVRVNKIPSEMKTIDSMHQSKIKRIFTLYGFPNEKLIRGSTLNESIDITTMMMHFNDVEYFKPILLEFIKKGECSPSVLANMVDSNDRKENLFTYGIYENLDTSKIKDFKNLNMRRTSIGLRTIEQHKKTRDLIIKKYKSKN